MMKMMKENKKKNKRIIYNSNNNSILSNIYYSKYISKYINHALYSKIIAISFGMFNTAGHPDIHNNKLNFLGGCEK